MASSTARHREALVFNALTRVLGARQVFASLPVREEATSAILQALATGQLPDVRRDENPAPESDHAGLVMMLIEFDTDGKSRGTSYAVEDPALAAHVRHLIVHLGEPMTDATGDQAENDLREKFSADRDDGHRDR